MWLRRILHPVMESWRNFCAARRLKATRRRGGALKLVIGASGKFDRDWLPVEQGFLDIRRESDWAKRLQPGEVSNFLAEHVFEHLTAAEAAEAAGFIYTYLAPGGRFRVAVPDGWHPDPAYIDLVKPGGSGDGSLDHKELFDFDSFSAIFTARGFIVEPIEYFDRDGGFHSRPLPPGGGYIHRALANDPRNADGKPHYTSLVIDAVKPS